MDDRRVFARIDSRFPVRFLDSTSGQEGRADTIDISANGLGLLAQQNLSVRTPLEMWLDIPDQHEPLYTRGEVVWSGPFSEREGQRVGVRLEKAELMGLARILWMRR
ncbi:MAG: PilZ domain-containing protein, partial [Candidatus Omnitrophota bacterium]